jgi:hypothetical protein
MNPQQMAALAAAVLTPYFVKGDEVFTAEVGKVVGQKVGGLLGAIQQQHSELFALLPQATQSENRDWLQQLLLTELQKDATFASNVGKHLQAFSTESSGARFLTQVYGGEVDKIINIEHADVIHFD